MAKPMYSQSLQHLRNSPLATLGVLTIAATVFLLTACGISVGGGSLNAAAPSGTVIYTGTFNGVNGNTASGTASVYQQSAGSYALYLNGLTAPSLSNLNVVLTGSGGTPVNTSLQGTTGSQVYNFTAGYATFSSVSIHSTSLNQDVAQAPLYATSSTTNPTN